MRNICVETYENRTTQKRQTNQGVINCDLDQSCLNQITTDKPESTQNQTASGNHLKPLSTELVEYDQSERNDKNSESDSEFTFRFIDLDTEYNIQSKSDDVAMSSDCTSMPKTSLSTEDIETFLVCERTRLEKRKNETAVEYTRKKRKTSKSVKENSTSEDHRRSDLLPRPSSNMCRRLRNQIDAILDAEVTANREIRAYCPFCVELIGMNFIDWKRHLLAHTEENEFYCAGCNTTLSSQQQRHCKDYKVKENFQKDRDLRGFICKLCDYLQVNKHQMIEHITNDHTKDKARDYMEQIMLVPNLLREIKPIYAKFDYIPIDYRYSCGIESCRVRSESAASFRKHFILNHQTINEFPCPNCNYSIKMNETEDFLTTIFNHLHMHGNIVNQCVACDEIFASDHGIISHLLMSHTKMDSIIYRHDYRGSHGTNRQCEVIILIECNFCQLRFENHEDAHRHYLNVHQSHNSNFKLIQLSKSQSHNGDTINYTLLKSERTFLLLRKFTCDLCKDVFGTKDEFIGHHVARHRYKNLAIKFNENYLDTENAPIVMDPPDFDQYLVYHCDHCIDSGHSNLYVSFDEVYKHWSAHHAKKPESKPFRFAVGQLAICGYCDVVSTFEGLQKHQLEHHPTEKMIIENLLDRSKCGLCQSNDKILAQHFVNNHQLILEINVNHPIALANHVLDKLTKLKGHKKRKCSHCAQAFETEHEAHDHHIIKHPSFERDIEEFYDIENVHFITGCCQKKIEQQSILDHFRTHQQLTKTTMMTYYWQTKAIFGNGLVVNLHNFIGTDFDYSWKFEEFLNRML